MFIKSLQDQVDDLKENSDGRNSPSLIMLEEFQAERDALNATNEKRAREIASLEEKNEALEEDLQKLKNKTESLEKQIASDKPQSVQVCMTPKRSSRQACNIPATPILSTPAGKESVNARLVRELKADMNKLNAELEHIQGEKRTLTFLKETESSKHRNVMTKMQQLEMENEKLKKMLKENIPVAQKSQPALIIDLNDEYEEPVDEDKRREVLVTIEDKENSVNKVDANDKLFNDAQKMPPPTGLPSSKKESHAQTSRPGLGRPKQGIGFSKRIGSLKDASDKNPEECTQQ